MTEGLKWTVNHVAKSDDKHLELMSEENVKKANEFHKSDPQYTNLRNYRFSEKSIPAIPASQTSKSAVQYVRKSYPP